LNFYSIFFLLLGSALGLKLRLFVQNNFKIKLFLYIRENALINILSSLFLGILIALELTNKNLLLLFYIGFLGCFSTFSSFIYDLYTLFRNKQYSHLIFHYIEVLILSFIFFYFGFCLVKIL